MPGSIYELADANLQHGMQGTRSYRNFPVWGRVIKDELVQVVTPYEQTYINRFARSRFRRSWT